MKKMIFHLPFQVDKNRSSGSQIRPLQMIKSFEDNNLFVELVEGNLKKRNKKIKELRNRINQGEKFDFVYSENSTMPNALTEKHHLPLKPLLDHNFLLFCNRKNIPIGLFYRDIHWEFDQYKKSLAFHKRIISLFFYKLDLRFYKKYVKVLYLPSLRMLKHIPFDFKGDCVSLPPGSEELNLKNDPSNFDEKNINFIYVGGVSQELYNLKLLVDVFKKNAGIKLNLCVRKDEWEKEKLRYPELNDKISIHHLRKNELNVIYKKTMIAILFIKPTPYWDFAMPVKLFEYISYGKPVIVVKNTAVGDFVEKYDIGWVVNYNEKDLELLLASLSNNNFETLKRKQKNIKNILNKNTWKQRAGQVITNLK